MPQDPTAGKSLSDLFHDARYAEQRFERRGRELLHRGRQWVEERIPTRVKEAYREMRGYKLAEPPANASPRKPTGGRRQTGRRR